MVSKQNKQQKIANILKGLQNQATAISMWERIQDLLNKNLKYQ